MNILSVRQSFRDLRRIRQIITILIEEGFHSYLSNAKLAHHGAVHKRIRSKHRELTPERARIALERLGPTFVKLGQVLSLRPDLIPEAYCKEFKQLQDHVPPIPTKVIHQILKEELGRPSKKIFKHFSENPLAAASIAQVHQATLHDGTKVVVKVQRPRIRGVMRTDIDIMKYIAERIDRKYPHAHATESVKEFEEYTEREIDLTNEFHNVKLFHTYFAGDKEIVIPRAFEDLSTKNVLVLEFVDGTRVSELKQLKAEKVNLKKIMAVGTRAIMQQVFDLGVFHADPHPGNLLVIKKGRTQKLAFIDFGIVGFLEDDLQRQFIELLEHLSERDAVGIAETLIKMSDHDGDFPTKDFEHKIGMNLKEWDVAKNETMSEFVYHIILTAIADDLQLPTAVITVAKAFVTMEGTGKYIQPDLDIMKEVQPYMTQALAKHLGPGQIKKQLTRDIPKAEDALRELPGAINTLIEKVKKGQFEMHLDTKSLGSIAKNYDVEMQRRNLVILAASLFIGSALLAGMAPDVTFYWPLYVWGFMACALTLLEFLHASMKIHKYWEKTG